MDKNEISVHFRFKAPSTQLEGYESLLKQLSDAYVVTSEEYPAPAAGGLFDAVIELYINYPLIAFFANAVAGGMTWDLIKAAGRNLRLRPFLSSLKQFQNTNPAFDLASVRLTFNDATIEVHSPLADGTSTIEAVCELLSGHFAKLIPTSNLSINRIVVPVVKTGRGYGPPGPWENHPLDHYWGIEYRPDFSRRVYSAKKGKLLSSSWDLII